MSKTSSAKAATIPIQIVLERDSDGNLHQRSLSPAVRQQLRDRYDEIEGSGDPAQTTPFHQAFYHAARHHPGDPEPVIIVSLTNRDEITCEVLDQNGVAEPGFTVDTPPQQPGDPPHPFNGLPNPPGLATKVHSGHVKMTHLR